MQNYSSTYGPTYLDSLINIVNKPNKKLTVQWNCSKPKQHALQECAIHRITWYQITLNIICGIRLIKFQRIVHITDHPFKLLSLENMIPFVIGRLVQWNPTPFLHAYEISRNKINFISLFASINSCCWCIFLIVVCGIASLTNKFEVCAKKTAMKNGS